jgi:hypothetical protein
MSHIPKPVLVEVRLRFGLRQSSAAFKSEVTLSILAISSYCKSVSIRVHPWLNSFFPAQAVANPKRKSTAACPKSTVDLYSESLIWVEKRPANALSSGFRHSLCPITMRELWNAGQKQTKKRIMQPLI